MPKRVITSDSTLKPARGAVDNNTALVSATFVATGVCVAPLPLMVMGSTKATFALSGLAATGCAIAATRLAQGKDVLPDWFKKSDDEKKAEKKADDKSSESSD